MSSTLPALTTNPNPIADGDLLYMVPAAGTPDYKVPASALKTYIGASTGPTTLFNHVTEADSSGTGETDLYSDSIVAGTLTSAGQALVAEYSLSTDSAAAVPRFRAYFAGTLVFDSTAYTLTFTEQAVLRITVTMLSGSSVRVSASFLSNNAAYNYSASTNSPIIGGGATITGLNLATTGYILKCTGTNANSALHLCKALAGKVQLVP